ncbi:MAG: NrsF family protein [Vicinamibacterales bacterium]
MEPPPDLLTRVEADLAPVRPASTVGGVGRWLPLALAVLVGLPLYVGVRSDAQQLGPWLTWGVSAVQFMTGIWFVWAGATEGRPDRRLPTRLLGGALGAAAVLVIGVTSLTYAVSPTTLGEALPPWRAGTFCFQGSVFAAAPLLLLAGGLLGRTLPGLPWLTGALFGAGAGMTADATWRLMCPVSDPWHVLTAHGGAVLALGALGAIAAEVAARRRSRVAR